MSSVPSPTEPVSSSRTMVRKRQPESECLRSKVETILSRVFPGRGRAANCCPSDLNLLLAVFNQSRKATLENTPRLSPYTKFNVLDELFTHLPYHFVNDDTAFHDMRRYLTLLAEVLRSFGEDVKALQHEYYSKWYNGINQLFAIANKASSPDGLLEYWDTAVLLKNCQYLVLAIQDLSTRAETLFEFGGQVVKGILQGYGSQYSEAWITTKGLMSRRRNREDWHNLYLQYEQLCFTTVIRIADPKTTSTDVIDWDATELEVTIALRDTLDDELLDEQNTAIQRLRHVGGRLGQIFQASGPYEENRYYFTYGILELLYYMTHRVTNRRACFEEIVGAIHLILERAERSANLLHRKAVELYHTVNNLGESDGITYGNGEERDYIEKWIGEHATQIDSKEKSIQRIEHVIEEMNEIELSEKSLEMQRKESLQRNMTNPRLNLDLASTPMTPRHQETVQSGVFPLIPSHEPGDPPQRPQEIAIDQPARYFLPPIVASPSGILEPSQAVTNDFFSQQIWAASETSLNISTPAESVICPLEQVSSSISSASASASSVPNISPDSQGGAPQSCVTVPMSIEEAAVYFQWRATGGTDQAPPPPLPFGINSQNGGPRSPVTISIQEAAIYFKWREQGNSPGLSRSSSMTSGVSPSRSWLFRRRRSSTSTTSLPSPRAHSKSEQNDLRNVAPSGIRRIPERVELKEISASGNKIAVLGKKTFWVFNTHTLSFACFGDFTNGKDAFQYATKDGTLQTQHPIPLEHKVSRFTCAALSDTYLAVGCNGRVMAFVLEGKHAGRWIVLESFDDKEAPVEKLSFSADGAQLIALLKVASGVSHQFKAVIYSTSSFPLDNLDRKKPIRPESTNVLLKDWQTYCPRGVAFSSQGTLVAICTNYVRSRDRLSAGIQLLKKNEDDGSWDLWGPFDIVKLPYNDDTAWREGFTGLAFFHNDQYIATSIDSKDDNVADCFGISSLLDGKSCKLTPYKRVFSPKGIAGFAITVSQSHEALVLLDDKGRLHLRGGIPGQEIHQLERTAHHPTKYEHISHVCAISFCHNSNRLLVLDRYARLETHDLDPEIFCKSI